MERAQHADVRGFDNEVNEHTIQFERRGLCSQKCIEKSFQVSGQAAGSRQVGRQTGRGV